MLGKGSDRVRELARQSAARLVSVDINKTGHDLDLPRPSLVEAEA
jgi:hypothetical protein